MEPSELKPGMEVVHVTGGGVMAVVSVEEFGEVLCEWRDKNGNPQRAKYAAAALKPKPPPARPQVVNIGRH